MYSIEQSCLDAVTKYLPIDQKSFSASKEAKEQAKHLAKLFAWLLSMPELTFPEDGRVLGIKESSIPIKYYCQLAPQLKPTECGFQPHLESEQALTVNQRLFLNMTTLVGKFIRDSQQKENNATATRYLIKKQGTIQLFPHFWSRNVFVQIAIILHELHHFYIKNNHVICPKGKGHYNEGTLACDAALWSGPYSADLLMSEIFLRTALRVNPRVQSQMMGLSGSDDKIQRCHSKELCLADILSGYCAGISQIIVKPFHGLQGLDSLCGKDYKTVTEWIQAAQLFMESHPELFTTGQGK